MRCTVLETALGPGVGLEGRGGDNKDKYDSPIRLHLQ